MAEGHDRAVATPDEGLELGLGGRHRAGGKVGRLGVKLDRLAGGQRGERLAGPGSDRLRDLLRREVEVVGILIVDRGADVLPVIAKRRGDLLLCGDDHLRPFADQVERRHEAVHREQLGYVGAILRVDDGRDLRGLAVLGCELGRRGDPHLLDLLQRALGEDRELADRLDLDVEAVDPHRVLAGGREAVENAAADCELAAFGDLLLAAIAGLDQRLGHLVEVDQPAPGEREGPGPQRRVGELLRERHR